VFQGEPLGKKGESRFRLPRRFYCRRAAPIVSTGVATTFAGVNRDPKNEVAPPDAPEARAPDRTKILRLAENPRTEGVFPMRTGNATRSRRENPHDARSNQGQAVSWLFMKRDERP
jgi:hypothetical protein